MTPLFGVDRSFRGSLWRERLDRAGHAQAMAMTQAHGTPDLLARILAGRGVTADGVQDHLRPSLRALMPDPTSIVDMEAAVERLARAVERREHVAIVGDYDVDGATSAALLGSYLRRAGVRVSIHIPDRVTEGYGPNATAVANLAAQGATLLVTVDCGTGSHAVIAGALHLGLDTIVVDHHRAPLELPRAVAIVNANRRDDLSGLGHLCAAGLVFMVLAGLNRRLRAVGFWSTDTAPDLLAELDLVALGTVADVVPLTGLNRAFVAQGLAVMRARSRPGLRALFDMAGADGPPTAYHLGFLIGPRINAGGRIGDAALGTRLLMTEDEDEATTFAAQLDRHNRERRVIEGAAAAEAERLAHEAGRDAAEGGTGVIVCAGAGWHPGIVGIVAARLVEQFGRPAFALALHGDIATGSGRSIAGVDIGQAVQSAVDAGILVKGGGHAMAAGITVKASDIAAFRTFLGDRLGADVSGARANAVLAIDATMHARAMTPELVETLAIGGPFGAGYPEPVVAFPAHRLCAVQPVGTDHLRIKAEAPDGTTLSAVLFRAGSTALGDELRQATGRTVHLAGSLSLNRWGGSARAELRLIDAAPA